MIKRARAAVQGIVQGVGFRPFVYQLALRHGLSGYVANTPVGVEIEVEGEEGAIRAFASEVSAGHPPLAYIARIGWEEIRPTNEPSFVIRESQTGTERSALISPDVCICSECLSEMRDPANRRFRYPFINCTNCGPRYTIIMDIPYDRVSTTMRAFTMCRACQEEYDNPGDRRFHAQPNACWKCGPRMSLHEPDGKVILCDDPIRKGISLLEKGAILAIKGLGGFHLAVDACNHAAVVRLRKRKQREEKPLAVMVKDLDAACAIAHVSDQEAGLLCSRQRPIVLLKKRRSHGLSPQAAPRNRYLGIMLPYTPLHYLLMEGRFKALVMTSGNMTEEPICIDNETALSRLKGIADYFLMHNRDIHVRSDDSVIKVVGGVPRQIRRSRGYVPMPIFLPDEMADLPSVLAVGGELKNTICLTKGNRAFLSQHIGDMENLETFDFFSLTVSHLKRILEIEPVIMAHDLHPDYLSTRFAREQGQCPVIPIQHHHAHIVSCMAENRLDDPVIGLAFDGTGYGTDGTIWGGEILIADTGDFERAGHLAAVPMPGSAAAIKEPWRMMVSYLVDAFGADFSGLELEALKSIDPRKLDVIHRMISRRINTPLTSSLGRLFDAVAAICGIRSRVSFEGQAAMELEMMAADSADDVYDYGWEQSNGTYRVAPAPLIRGVVADRQNSVPVDRISARFHQTLIYMFADLCDVIRQDCGLKRVVLSGGCFQNAILLTGLIKALQARQFEVVTHRQVPANDGGIALGQAVVAAASFRP